MGNTSNTANKTTSVATDPPLQSNKPNEYEDIDSQIDTSLKKYKIGKYRQDEKDNNISEDQNDLNNSNDNNHKLKNIQNRVKINIKLIILGLTNHSFSVFVEYCESTTIDHVLKKAINKLNKNQYAKYKILYFKWKGIIAEWHHSSDKDFNEWTAKALSNFDKQKIKNETLEIDVTAIPIEHLPIGITNNNNDNNNSPITCPNMLKFKNCDIYSKMKYNYQFNNESDLMHICSFTHIENEYNNKPSCKYGIECNAFVRLEMNKEYRIDDRCHMILYRHPPRNRQTIKIKQNFNQFIYKNQKNSNEVEYGGTINKLMKELISNGFERDLCLNDKDYKNKDYSILKIVKEKIDHIKHKQMGFPLRGDEDRMLSLILYTGCDCNYDLCKSQRNGNYKKWECFDKCLYWAIFYLSIAEHGKYCLYSGLSEVKLNAKNVNNCHFPTYTSTTWNEIVAHGFMGDKGGMIMKFDEKVRSKVQCCDVSWISKFPNECEVLIARSDKNSIQNVSILWSMMKRMGFNRFQ